MVPRYRVFGSVLTDSRLLPFNPEKSNKAERTSMHVLKVQFFFTTSRPKETLYVFSHLSQEREKYLSYRRINEVVVWGLIVCKPGTLENCSIGSISKDTGWDKF